MPRLGWGRMRVPLSGIRTGCETLGGPDFSGLQRLPPYVAVASAIAPLLSCPVQTCDLASHSEHSPGVRRLFWPSLYCSVLGYVVASPWPQCTLPKRGS